MKKINLGHKELIHFVGIGGIGMSGLAQIMKNMGFRIQGSDQKKNKNTTSCSRSGIKIFIGHSSQNIKKATILVKSTAIKDNNIEIKYAKKNKIEKVDNSNATYEFMVISGFEREIDKDASRRGTAELPAEMQIKKLMKAGSQVMINFDFGTRSQANSELMKNARSYKTMASAVNALANNGWEFINANVVNLGTTKAHYYYMKRSK